MASLKNTTVAGTDSAQLPVGTTAQRPGSPVTGDLRFNTDFDTVEYYNGTKWLYVPNYAETGLVQYNDAAEPASYSGSGTTWGGIEGGNLTLVNGVGFSTDGSGSLDFDGTNDYASNTTINTSNTLSFNCWYKADATGGNLVSQGGNSGWRVRILSSQTNFFDRGTTNYIEARYAPVTGVWINLCVVGDSSGLKAYRNGVLIAQNSTAFGGGNTDNFYIGVTDLNGDTGGFSGTEWYNGKIGLIQLYNRALGNKEVWQNFQAFRNRYGV